MELESDMSIKAKAEVVIEHVQRKLEKGIHVHILKINRFFFFSCLLYLYVKMNFPIKILLMFSYYLCKIYICMFNIT